RGCCCPNCKQLFTPPLPSPAPPTDGIQAANPSPVLPALDPELPSVIGRFQVRARIGIGGFGTVYRAFDPQLDREVALKIPRPGTLDHPEQVERFLREAKAAAQLRHPYIVPLFEAGQPPHYYLASAFIEGRTLAASLEEGPLTSFAAAGIVRDLAEA